MRVIDLFEIISGRVFHYTRVGTALRILQSGKFELSHTLGTSWEQQFAPEGYPYFLSTTRTRHGGYHGYLGQDAVLFELDGDFYNQRYPGRAVDYWNNRDPMKDHHRAHEAEDRIFSRDNAIPAAIRVIDLYIAPDADQAARARTRQTIILAKKAGIPVNLFNDQEAWRQRDTRKLADVSQLRGQDPARGYVERRRGGYLKPWMELIQAKQKSQLSKDADSKRYNLQYTYDKQGMAKSLAVDLSNARKPGPDADRNNAVRVIQFMQQNRLGTVNDLVNFLADKWKNIKEDVSEGLRDDTIPSELTELFNTQPSKSAAWARPIGQWDDMDEFNFVASNGIAYQIDFLAPEVGPDELDPYTFFKPDEEISDQAYESAKFVEFEQKSKPGDVGKQGIEGTGAAAEVFGIVTNVILQYIKKAKPSMLYFQAAEPNRQRLYARMATRVAQTIGWKVKQDGSAHFAIYNPRKIKGKLPNQGVAEGRKLQEGIIDFVKRLTGFAWGKTGDVVRGSVVADYLGKNSYHSDEKLEKVKRNKFKLQNIDLQTAEKYRTFTDQNADNDIIDVDKMDRARDRTITYNSLIKNPPVLDRDGFVWDGNHRLQRAIELELDQIPVLMQTSNISIHEKQGVAEARKKKRRAKKAVYGPGRYGWYGYYTGYSGDNGGGEGMAEGVPQPGKSSGKPISWISPERVITKYLTLDEILNSVQGIPYYNEVVKDRDAKDFSWGVTKKVLEYARELIIRSDAYKSWPPIIVLDGKLQDGAHRISTINLMQKRVQPNNPIWKNAKLKVEFGKSDNVRQDQELHKGIQGQPLDELRYQGNLGIMELIKFFREYPQYKEKYLEIKNQKGTGAANQFAFNIMKVELEPIT